jgi:hypothetical protein
MDDYQTSSVQGLHLRLILPIIGLLVSATTGGTLIYLSLHPDLETKVDNARLIAFLSGVSLLLLGARAFYIHAKRIEWMVWVYNYGEIVPGRLTLTRDCRESSDLMGDLIIHGPYVGEGLLYRVRVSSPFLSVPVKKLTQIGVDVTIHPISGVPVAIDSGYYILWIVHSKEKKVISA